MLVNGFKQLLIMSVIAGGLYLILKSLSTLTRKYFTSAWHYYSNLIMYSFLLVPYSKIASLLDLNFGPTAQNGPELLSLMRLNQPTAINPTANDATLLQAKSYTAVSFRFDFVPYILLAGTLIFIAVILVQNYRLNRRVFRTCSLTAEEQTLEILFRCKQEMGIIREIPVYIAPCISTPFLYGSFKPRIVLPDIKFTSEELQYVFLHELTHWKRHDLWLKYLLLFINAVHWFNPLAYMARRDIDRFCELSCDESVVKSMNNQERRRYCELILSVLWNVTHQNSQLFSAFSDKRKHLERRINMILKSEGLKSKKSVRRMATIITLVISLLGTSAAVYSANRETTPNTLELQKDTSSSAFDAERQLNITSDGLGGSSKVSESKEVFLEATSSTNSDTQSPVGIMAVYNINWDVYACENAYGVSQLSMSQGNQVQYDISWSPQPGIIRVGLYNRNTGTFYWAASSSTPSLSGTITVPATGLYSFAVGNTTDTDVYVTGSFTY